MRKLLACCAVVALTIPATGCRSGGWWPWRTASTDTSTSPLATTAPNITLPSEVAATGGMAPTYPNTTASATAPAFQGGAATNAGAPGAQAGPYDPNAYAGATPPAGKAPVHQPYEPEMPSYAQNPPTGAPSDRYGAGAGSSAAAPSAYPSTDNAGQVAQGNGYPSGSRYDSLPPVQTPANGQPPATPQFQPKEYVAATPPGSAAAPSYSNPAPASPYGTPPAGDDRYAAVPDYGPPSMTPPAASGSQYTADLRNQDYAPEGSDVALPPAGGNAPSSSGSFRPGGTGDYIPPIGAGSAPPSGGHVQPADFQAPAAIQMPVSPAGGSGPYG